VDANNANFKINHNQNQQFAESVRTIWRLIPKVFVKLIHVKSQTNSMTLTLIDVSIVQIIVTNAKIKKPVLSV
jgi:hypothetical protein